MINAVKYLPDDYVVLIGGSGPLGDSLSKQIRDEKLEKRVKLLGRISDEDLPSYYAACDLYCLSSIMKTEAFAIVQIEAMSIGKPIVATNIPESGVSWVNADGVSGINVPIKDSKALADAIVKILENEDILRRYSNGAQERYNQLFTKDSMIEGCLSLYRNILESDH